MKIYIITEGGLGNQLFQASYGKHLEKHYNTEVVFVSITKSFRAPRVCELDRFGLKTIQLSNITGWIVRISIALLKRSSAIWPLNGILLSESHSRDFTNLPANKPLFVVGYWQQYKTTTIGAPYLRKIFNDFKLAATHTRAEPTRKRIAVHIRCGDYMNDPATAKKHLVCTPNYYLNAWSVIQNRHPDATLQIFSDDIDWVMNNIPFSGNKEYVQSTKSPAWIDLFKMAACDGYIISNSTYSWWAAILGDSPNKMTIAPSQWFNGVMTEELGLLPPHWHTIPTE